MTLFPRFRPVFVAILMVLAAATAATAQYRVSLTATPSAAVPGQTVTFRAVVTIAGVPATTGRIFLTGNGGASNVISMATPDAAGGATFSTDQLPIGRHEITARYNQTGTNVHNSLPASLAVPITVVAPGPFGNFTMPIPIAGACSNASVLADLNGDGTLDLAAVCADNFQLQIRFGNGDGTFGPVTAYATGHRPLDVVAGDLNVDGHPDLIMLGQEGGQWGHAAVSYFRNAGDGSFNPPIVTSFASVSVPYTFGATLAIIDIDGTRSPDIAFAVSSTLVAASGNALGAFTQRFTAALTSADASSLAVGDLNADGYHDIALTYTDWTAEVEVDRLSVFKGDGAYGFTPTTTAAPVPGAYGDIIVGDYDRDGRDDVVSTFGRMWPGQPDGSLGAAQVITAVGGYHMAAGEFNGDAALDIVTSEMKFLPGNLAGGFGAVKDFGLDLASPLEIGDLNNDGRLDVVVGSSVVLGGREATLALTVENAPSGQGYTVHADIWGPNAPATGGTVLFRLGGGPVIGTAPVDGNGHATLTPANWGPIGSWNMIAEFSGDSTHGRAWDAKPVTITSLGSVLSLFATPASPVSGETIYFTARVALQGPYTPTGTLTLSIDGQVVASGNPQQVQHAVVLPVGAHTITASYPGDSRFNAATTTQQITVSAASTRTRVSVSGGTVSVGASIAMTATVKVQLPATGLATGSVAFKDGGQVLATIPLAGGTASWVAPITTPGLHQIRAEYLPDVAALTGSTSASALYSAIHPGAGGGLRRAIDFPTAGSGGFVQLGDLNEDGRLDAVVAQGTVMSVFVGNGDLTYQPRIDHVLPDEAKGLAVTDVDGDGHVDVMVPLAANATDYGVRTFYGDGTAAFSRIFNTESQGRYLIAAAVGDLTDDGYPDLAAAMLNVYPQMASVRIVDVTTAGGGLAGPFDLPVAVAIGDITGDARNDVVVVDRNSLIMLIWGQQGRQQIQLDVHPTAVSLADLNHDGRADVIVSARTYDQRFVMLANGTGGFGAPVWIDHGQRPDPIVADIDVDGNPDLLELDGSRLVVMRGNGDGTFAARRAYGFAPGTAAAMADLNSDGLMDVITAGDALHVMAGAAGINMSVTSNRDYEVPARTPIALSVAIAALNAGDGTPSGPIHFRAVSTTVEGTREWTADVTPVDGVATFTNIYPSGWLTITAEYDGDATFGANGGAVDHFVHFSAEPPVFVNLADVTVETTDTAGADVAYPQLQVADSAGNPLLATCSPASGTHFAVGDTTVSCSATDVDGNTASGSFIVHVINPAPNTPPVLTLPGPIVAEADRKRGAPVTFTVLAMDAEDGALIPKCTPKSGRVFPIGTTTVSCTAKDSKKLVATGSFTVTVQDTTAPEVIFKGNKDTYEAHQNVNIRCTAKDTVSDIASTTCVDVLAPAYTFALGINTLTATATDGAGNAGQGSTSFTVVTTIASLKNLVRDFSTVAKATKALIEKLNANDLAGFRTLVQSESGKALTAEQATILLRLTQ